jgi:hypothetical protein
VTVESAACGKIDWEWVLGARIRGERGDKIFKLTKKNLGQHFLLSFGSLAVLGIRREFLDSIKVVARGEIFLMHIQACIVC